MGTTLRPSDITLALRRPARWEGWIPTFSGTGFNVLDPKPEHIRISDIAQGLAYKFRYGGQVTPVTPAEHSILVSTIIETLWPASGKMLAGLLHDACQAYLQDVQTPVRKFIKVELPCGDIVPWTEMETRLNQAVAKSLGMEPGFWGCVEVKAANILAVVIEKQQCPVLQRSGSFGLPPVPAEISHLQLQYLPPEEALIAFLRRYADLKG